MLPARTLLCLSLGACLQAAPPVHFGAAFHLNAPLSDLKTDLHDKVGLGGSFQVSFELGDRGMVRPRLDLDAFPVSAHDRPNSNYREEVGFSAIGLGADWLYAFSGDRNRGAYGLVGLGMLQWYQTYSATDHTSHTTWYSTDHQRNRTSPWVALGLGWQVTQRVGLELRGVGSRYDAPEVGGLQAPSVEVPTTTRTAVSLQAAVNLRW
jgi:hypothetical protein